MPENSDSLEQQSKRGMKNGGNNRRKAETASSIIKSLYFAGMRPRLTLAKKAKVINRNVYWSKMSIGGVMKWMR